MPDQGDGYENEEQSVDEEPTVENPPTEETSTQIPPLMVPTFINENYNLRQEESEYSQKDEEKEY